MHIIDSHFHWWPRSVFEALCKRKDFPRSEPNDRGGYEFFGPTGRQEKFLGGWTDWFDIDEQLAHMDSLGHQVDVVCSIGPFSVAFSYMDKIMGRDFATQWNEEMAWAQRTHPGRVWASAAVPLVDTQTAIDVVDHAINKLGLMGVNLPGSVGDDPRIDAERLEPFYDYVEKLGVPLFLHPTDAVFQDMLIDGYNGALFVSLGRVIEVSVAAMRLIFSGVMERHPNLKIFMSHTGGALPYQSGRMDKNGKGAKLPHPPSEYIHRMYTDTVTPHTPGHEVGDRVFRRRSRDVRHRLSVLGSGDLLEALQRDEALGRRSAQDLLRQRQAHPEPQGSGAGEDGGSGARDGAGEVISSFFFAKGRSACCGLFAFSAILWRSPTKRMASSAARSKARALS